MPPAATARNMRRRPLSVRNCLNNDTESISMANDICNRGGLDTISGGSVIAFAMELYENGILTQQDTGGIDLKWGNHQAIVTLTEKSC
jgi:aldehyde:ferredoxin oxidoreductase